MTVRHPAKYTDKFIPIFAEKLKGRKNVIDIFAGTCKISKIKDYGFDGDIFCNEIEPEWANFGFSKVSGLTVGDAEFLPYKDGYFEAICTSPTYGNRMADHFEAKDGSKRNTYRHSLGRGLNEENTGKMQWGKNYKEKHEKIWKEAHRVLCEKGILILNVKDHIRKGEVIEVSNWHKETLLKIGFILKEDIEVETSGLGFGSNAEKRLAYEHIMIFEKKHDNQGRSIKKHFSLNLKKSSLVWESDWNGSEVGHPNVPVVGLFTQEKLDGVYYFYMDYEKNECIEFHKEEEFE